MHFLKKEGRPFNPTQVIFAPSAQCNLFCEHCFVDRSRGLGSTKMQISEALAFLENCAQKGITKVGFSGGEPFLETDFISEIIQKTISLDLAFDRLMTNGIWWNTLSECKKKLNQIYTAGFDGTLSLSFDSWHGQDPKKIATFLTLAFDIFSDSVHYELTTVSNKEGLFSHSLLHELAENLDMQVKIKNNKPIGLYRKKTEIKKISYLPISCIQYSENPTKNNWHAKKWFKNDFCEGPGHIFYVHPDARVAVCCGFANEKDQLIVGSITDKVDDLIQKACLTEHIHHCYVTGLATYRKILAKKGIQFPGRTDDPCYFCAWLCSKDR